MEDDKVYKLAVNRIQERQAAYSESEKTKLSAEAKDKRSSLLSQVPDADKPYTADIKALLEKTSDYVIMHPDWSFEDVRAFARGRYLSPEKVQEIEKAAFNRGKEEREILGAKPPKPAGGNPPAPKAGLSETLTEDEKSRARDMYKVDGLTDDQKYEMFIDLKKHKKTVDKNKG
jgi:hypothetical protein